MTIKKTIPTVSIGIPVHNGENTISRAIQSILSQTFTNYEIIISDNASTDLTEQICEEYIKKDSRIKYFYQKQYVNWVENWSFVLKKAKGEYFVWLADDDFWEPTFLEKNIEVLNLNEDIVGSVSDIKLYGKMTPNFKKIVLNNLGIQEKFQYVVPMKGEYDVKVKLLLKLGWATNLCSVFRTHVLRKSMIKSKQAFVSIDFAIILNLLKYGDLEVIDEFLANRSTGGWTSTESFIDLLKKEDIGLVGIIFPYAKFTSWCLKNLGIKLFLKNIRWFAVVNKRAERKIICDVLTKICSKYNQKNVV